MRWVTKVAWSVLNIVSCHASIQLPKLLGPHQVGTKRIEVVDQGRLDPWAPTPSQRSPMLQFWYPVETNKSLEPSLWLPPNAAKWQEKDWKLPPETLAGIKTRTFANGNAIFPLTEDGTTPVLVFSPGFGGLCAWYSGFLSSLASFGYTIIGVDHPYDSAPLERPNGELVLRAATIDDIVFAAQVRKADVLWLAGQIARESLCSWLPSSIACKKRLGENITLDILGQSLGGTTANLAMQENTTLYKGSVSIDGPFFKPLNETGFHGPLFYMAAENSSLHGLLVKEWSLVDGWKLAVKVKGAIHLSFSDFPALEPKLGEGDCGDVGRVEGARINEIMAVYIKAFWDWILLKKQDGKLLKHESEDYPDVAFQHLDKDTGWGRILKDDL